MIIGVFSVFAILRLAEYLLSLQLEPRTYDSRVHYFSITIGKRLRLAWVNGSFETLLQMQGQDSPNM